MDNERPNEPTLWSSRLEEPGALTGVGLIDKEATWEKLYDRLRARPRRRPLPWFRAAAACLLLALIQPKVLTSPGQPPTDPSPGKKAAVIAQSILPVPPSADKPPHPARREKHIPAKRSIPALAPIISKTPARPSPSDPRILDPSQPIPLAVLPPPKPKKELRVVHNNELEPAGPAPSLTGERLRPNRLRLSIGLGETFRPTTAYQTDHPIISFKHAPNP